MAYKKRGEVQADTTKSCRCGTGNYCHRHLRYGIKQVVYDMARESDYRKPVRLHGDTETRCGGGAQVIKKGKPTY